MNKNSYLIVMMFLALSAMPLFTYGRNPGESGIVALKVAELIRGKTDFRQSNLFIPAANQSHEQISKTIRKYTLLRMNDAELNFVLQSQPEFLRITLPGNTISVQTNLLLYKVNISSNGFTLETNDGNRYEELNRIVHYRGIIEGDMNSVASFSFSMEEVMGLMSNETGNMVFGELENTTGNEYVFYNDRDLVPAFTYECGTNTSNIANAFPQPQNNNNPGIVTTNCVDWYYEIDYDIFVGKGSLANVNSYIQGVFNQVSTLYNNDGVSITLQTLYVWTTTDPYTGTSTSAYLNQFGAYRTSFAGDLANLVGYAGGGGIAYINGLCGATQYKMAYMGIGSSYNTVPTYSWTVEVVTHEDGHLLGSRHTHDCVWNGNSTAIDGCGDAAGYNGSGTCATGPMPASGTIMSYCHLVSGVGINFNNGFGTQPLGVILNSVNNASCLAACSACSTPAQPGTITGATSYCGVSSQTYSVTAVAGATGYTWTKPSGWSGTSTTNTITVTTTSTGGILSVTADNACGSSSARTLSVAASSSPSQPGNISGATTYCGVTTQTYSVSQVAGATSYAWTIPSGWSGTSATNSITVTTTSTGGTLSVTANNSCGSSTARTLSVTTSTAPAQPGTISGNATVCPGTSQTYSVSAVSGATSYIWSLPSGWSGSSTGTSITATPGSSGGTVSVIAANSCGNSAARTLTVSINAAPAQPGTIAAAGGNTKVCPGTIKTYSIAAVSGATSYNWIPAPGSTITSGQGTISVTVSYNSGFIATDSIKVAASNGCATSNSSFLIISRDNPARPSVITGAVTGICNGSNIPYSVTNVSGITYNWYFSIGSASVSTGQGTNAITAAFTPNYLTGTLNVTATNACGTSTVRAVTIKAAPAQPQSLSGTTTTCSGQFGVPYSTSPVTGATSYTWTVPSGARINDGTVTSTTTTLTTTATAVTVNFSTTAGYVRVKANNSCSSSSNRSKYVSFNCRIANTAVSNSFEARSYPNPAKDVIHVQFESENGKDNMIKVIDLSGKTYLLHSGKSSDGLNEMDINVEQLAPGIYFLEIINGNEKSVSKMSIE